MTARTNTRRLKPLKDALEEFREAAPYKMPEEISLRHPENDIGVHLRDDGMLEIFAGQASILLDSETGEVIITGTSVTTCASDKEYFLEGGLSINGMRLDPFWYNTDDEVVMPLDKTSLQTPYLISGAPGPGQTPVPLSDLLKSRRLFKEKKRREAVDALRKVLE